MHVLVHHQPPTPNPPPPPGHPPHSRPLSSQNGKHQKSILSHMDLHYVSQNILRGISWVSELNRNVNDYIHLLLFKEPPSASVPAAPAGEDPSPDTKPPLSVETTAPTPTTGATPLDSLGSISPGGTTKVKKSRVDKDVNAPKKPANAFLKFCQQRRFSIQEQYRKVRIFFFLPHSLSASVCMGMHSVDQKNNYDGSFWG